MISLSEGEELEKKVMDYLNKVTKVKARSVHTAIGEEKKPVDKVLGKLAGEDKIEYLYLETSYVKLKGKDIPDAGKQAV